MLPNSQQMFILVMPRAAAGFMHKPVYMRRFFQRGLGFAETAVRELITVGHGPV
jgi:hypothetical protein